MTDEGQIPAEGQQPLTDVVKQVRASLASGKRNLEVVDELVADGWEENDALELVRRAGEYVPQVGEGRVQRADGGGGSGWLIWIGLLLLINFLSWLFNWPFWVY